MFNLNGQRVSIWDGTDGHLIQGQVYWGATPVEFYAASQAHFQHQDWLGTERVQTSYNGVVEGSYTSLPYGDGYSVSGSDIDPYHFAMLDTDSSSDTNHAQFRQYSDTAGRWMSPDPYAGSYDINNPQSMNRYSYVLNLPLSYVDPFGLQCTETQTNSINGVDTSNCTVNGSNDDGGNADDGEDGLDGLDGVDGGAGIGAPAFLFFMGSRPHAGGRYAPNKGKPKSPARQQCEAEAQQNFDATMQSLDSGFWPNIRSGALKGAVLGGAAGCLVTLEAGCVEGAVPFAIVGSLRGASFSAGQTIIRGTIAYSQFKSAMAACAAL